jgi:hypothetical protein
MRALATALALATVLLAGGCGDEQGAGASGDHVQGRIGDLAGTSYGVSLPNGELTVVVADGQASIDSQDAADGQEHEAPDGTQWVGLDWRLDPGAGLDPLQRSLMEDTSQRTSLTLVAGDTRVDLGDAPGSTDTPAETRTSGVVYVAIDTDVDPVVEVSFAGVTASLDIATGEVTGDQVSALADLDPPVAADCPRLRGSRGSAEVACTYVVTRVPYLAGEGWSDEGWTVAQVETRADTFSLSGATYAVQSVEDASSLGEGEASTVVDERLDSLVARVVAEGAPTSLEIVRTFSGVLTDGDGPDDATVELTSSVDLP